MEEQQQQVFLPLPPPPPVLIPADHLPRTPAHPPRASHPLNLLLRALASSSMGVAMRKFLIEFVKQLFSDPKRMKKWLAAYFARKRPRIPWRSMLLGRKAKGTWMQLLERLLRSMTVKGLIIVLGTFMLIHAGAGRGARHHEEAEEALLERRLPDFVRQGLRGMVTPPAPVMLPHQRRERDMYEILRMERIVKGMAHRDGVKNTEQAVSASVAREIQSMVHDTKIKFDKESWHTSLEALTETSTKCEGSMKTKFEGLNEKFCKEVGGQFTNFKDLFSKFEVEKEKLAVECELQRKEEKGTVSDLEKTVAEKFADDNKMKQALVSLRKTARCRATNRTAKSPIYPAKALPCEVERQRSPGKDSDGNDIIVVRMANLARQRPLPCVHSAAVRTSLPCAQDFAVRLPSAVAPALPCALTPKRTAKEPPGTPPASQEHRLAPRGAFAVCVHTAK
ncbi:hypothetical protein QYE76_060336 [Lolium multiflorum]|uniref:Uncharacterized protein n=1 Tax=Lolium multiflorum TaxID=4521 RepID=A0AAD8RYL8_LOLMU|nr:hypothetical protein QYE76_060336 [Lolium multiflorum]